MDFKQAQDQRGDLPGERGDRQAIARKRAADARMRRAIREAFAHQRNDEAPRPEAAPLRVVEEPVR